MYSKCKLESSTVESNDGVTLRARVFKPNGDVKENLAIVLVHPYSILGGCQGLLRGIAAGLTNNGYMAVTFDMRGVGRSTGRPSLTGFSEVNDVISVCKWVCENLSANTIVLLSSWQWSVSCNLSNGGAPIAGSAVDLIEQVIGFVSIGYAFGLIASILFGT
ncbi:hypothetical protein Nepgr_013349 [Nepenthes gracilis]|uniref:Xaa-Pro dipeptidyl-peptidase-like domain-containing protein n=1 Tax=Nepenthes gracilis TaxID=150966 RepID=A0AAD3SHQ1_NEPGR|nr:hypothetical protein Nepgr_013349 [Nepenthes gracilis]